MSQYPTRELMRIAAQRVLDNRDAQRGVDPLAIEWAQTVLRQNPPHESRTPVRAHLEPQP